MGVHAAVMSCDEVVQGVAGRFYGPLLILFQNAHSHPNHPRAVAGDIYYIRGNKYIFFDY
jgi:hypothetical protein